MGILGKCETVQQRFLHGGCEVLRLIADTPAGDTVAAQHFAAMAERLCNYAKRVCLSEATDALNTAAACGQSHLFLRRRYRIGLAEVALNRGHRITLTVTLSQIAPKTGEEILFFRELISYWDATGSIQLKKPLPAPRSHSKKHPASAKQAVR